MFTSKTDLRATPQDFFDRLNDEFKFNLDPCATPENAKCEKYFTKEEDGLSKSRDNQNVFCNPPYWKEIKNRVQKAYFTRGGGLSLCFYPQEQTQNGFMIIFGKNQKSDLSRGVWNLVDQKILHPFRQWLLYLEIK